MLYGLLADLVLVIHLGFVLFVVGGALVVLKWPRIAWLHVPAATWGVMIEFMGWICPLTPLENRLLIMSGEAGYQGDFIAHYLLPLLYPTQLSRRAQVMLGLSVVFFNAALYGWVLAKMRHTPHSRLST
jgi:hypothetical protein